MCSTVSPRRWVACYPNLAYPSTNLPHQYTFQKPLNVRGITRVLPVYINRLVSVCVCVCVCTNAYSSQIVGRTVSKFCLPPKPAYRYLTVPLSKLYNPPKWWKRASSRFSWRKVWNGVKCNFSSPHHHVWKIVGQLSIRRVRVWNFTRIGPKTKRLWLSIIPARRPSEQPGLGPPQKGVNCNSPQFDKPYDIGKLSISNT